MMPDTERQYRKNLTSEGLIYLGGQELEISVRNLSITGLLAELSNNASISNIKDVFESIKVTPTIDIFLPEMSLAGEADIVRADMVQDQVYLAMEFRNLSYDVNNMLYKRKAYRKNMTSSGQIVLNGIKHDFSTKNVSIDGLMVQLNENIEVREGLITIFDFEKLKLRGKIKVIWVEHDEDSTLMGLQYVQLENEEVQGIPIFSPNS
jgi:hypothetical protein